MLTWKPVAGTSISYNVYRKASGELELLGNTSNSNYHDKTAVDGTEYEYLVATLDEFGAEGPAASVNVLIR